MAFFKMCLADNLQDAADCGGLPITEFLLIFKLQYFMRWKTLDLKKKTAVSSQKWSFSSPKNITK
jgi:hypothetical protein